MLKTSSLMFGNSFGDVLLLPEYPSRNCCFGSGLGDL